jgi:hypothetical protein
MSEIDNEQDGGRPDRHEKIEELSPSGRVRNRRRKHSGPYDAPIPEAADLTAMRIDWRTGKPVAASPSSPGAGGPDQAKLEELVRRVAGELGIETAAQTEAPVRPVLQGDHPADKIPPPLPVSLAGLNQNKIFHESIGKRKRKHGDEHGTAARRHCPFCQHNRALHIRPTNPLARLISFVGIRTYSCRNCHRQFLALSFIEGPYVTWRQIGIFALIVLLMLIGYVFISPLFNRMPDLAE